MDEPSIATRDKSRFDRIMIGVGGVILIIGSSVALRLCFDGSPVSFGHAIPVSICLLFFVWGLCCLFPKLVAPRVRKVRRYIFNLISAPIKRFRPSGGYWENKYFLATFFFAFAALEYHGAITADARTPDWKYALFCLATVAFAGGGLFALLPKTMTVLSKVVLWIAGIAIVCALIYGASQAVSSLSIPAAIIIGAIIIAYAVSSQK